MAWKASVKKEKETRWFSRKFCVCEARKGPNPTPFIADDSWPLFVLSVRGNPKWGTSRDQWNSALNYLIYWSSSKTLKTICASEAPKLLAPIYAQNKNTTILSQEKLPHLYPVLSTKYYRLFQMSAILISKEKHGVWKFQKSLIHHCERSELCLNEWTTIKKMPKIVNFANFWKTEATCKTVLPDMTILIG